MTLGERVQLLRRRKGWTQAQLSAEIGVAGNTLSRIERGENPNPHVNIIRKLAEAFGITTDYLLRREDAGDEPQDAAAGADVLELTATPAAGLSDREESQAEYKTRIGIVTMLVC